MFGFLTPKDPQTIVIEGSENSIQTQSKETILNAALRQGVRFPHSCKVGGCASCKCQLLEGEVKELTESAYILSEEDLENNMILACQAIPKTEVKISLGASNGKAPKPLQSAGKVINQTRLTHDIVELTIETYQPINFLAGQYAQLNVPGTIEEPRCYSFAEAPSNSKQLKFYIRQIEGGEMSTWANSNQALSGELTVDGPYGDFYLRDSQSPMLMIAGGSGLAPVKAVLEDALNFKNPRPVTFLFGARTQADLYCLKELESIAQNWAGEFQFIPVLSEEPEGSDWQGARGMVTEFMDKHATSETQLYMCGPPPMLDAAERKARELGVEGKNIFADKFTDKSTR